MKSNRLLACRLDGFCEFYIYVADNVFKNNNGKEDIYLDVIECVRFKIAVEIIYIIPNFATVIVS